MGFRRKLFTLSAVVLSGAISACANSEDARAPSASETGMIKKATPILFVDDVQQSVDFFADRLGFTKTMEVPYERGLQFAAVASNDVEIMFQASDVNDETFTKAELSARVGQGFIYFEIDDFEKIVEAVSDAEIVKDAHDTNYGAKEIYIREPGGNVLGFAKQAE
ncbi:MAG: hypothetical protein DHS20C05_00310 [Hyphococcus sp.]|nr:MAG: hypothetical protein DHS20C05_00310 [Marinicaulis sp.]